jgi:hypothetical protein
MQCAWINVRCPVLEPSLLRGSQFRLDAWITSSNLGHYLVIFNFFSNILVVFECLWLNVRGPMLEPSLPRGFQFGLDVWITNSNTGLDLVIFFIFQHTGCVWMPMAQCKGLSVGALVTEGVLLWAGCLNHQLQHWALFGEFFFIFKHSSCSWMPLVQYKGPSVGALITEGVPLWVGCLNHQLQH